MRLHISLEDELVAELDKKVGKRKRSAYIASLLRESLDDRRRWEQILGAIGSIPDHGHDWDDDPVAWVREQRRGTDSRRG